MRLDPVRVKEVFLTAVEQPSPAERVGYLDAACAGNAELRRRVEALLAAHDQPSRAPQTDTIGYEAPDQGSEQPGARIGPYHLLQELGAGGMGTVWLAEQEVPVRRRVALK